MNFNKNDIEFINALAPYDHGVWEGHTLDGKRISVGEKALFSSRSTWLVEKIVNYLLDQFSLTSLEKMSVLEVGSYDGWVLTQICSRIKFSEAIGVEPRKKNIKKGEMGRHLSGVDTQASFILGSAENIEELFPDKQFDIVICLGMLHHVASTYDTLSNVSQMSRNVLIVDSMIIPELKNDIEMIQPFVNTRDIVYQGEENLWSVSAFKYESPYGDGSRKDFGIVNIPSAKLIEMSLNSCGFGPTSALGSENDFYDETGQKLRGVKELLCAAKREMSSSELDLKWKQKASSIEEIFCHKCMPEEIVFALAKCLAELEESSIYDDLCDLGPDPTSLEFKNNVKKIVQSGLDDNLKEYLTTSLEDIDLEHLQVLSVIFRSPHEKSILEICKFLIKMGRTKSAIENLKKITACEGCDWWSFYRACYLLKKAYGDLGDDALAARYEELLMLSNENFPF